MVAKISDPLDDLLKSAKEREKSPNKKINEKDSLTFSEQDIEKARQDTMDKIAKKVKAMTKEINRDDLAGFMLENRLTLVEQSKYMLNEYMGTLMTSLSSSPRAFEILTQLLSTTATINNSIVNINEDKAKVKSADRDKKLIENTTNIIGDIVKNNITTLIEQNKFKNKDKDEISVIKTGTDK